jgi:predicted AlkP superfamily phosphohydrolase/phosphomutase
MENKKKRQFSIASIGVWLGPVLLIIVVLSLVYTGRSTGSERTGSRVFLIGLDGLEWDIARPLMDEGRMPNLKRLVDEGTAGILMSRPITNSPVIWTTIATGKKREDHGIVGFFTDGQGHEGRTPYTSADRKVAALWNITSMENRSVCALGWWASWPAEEVNGDIVSAFAPYDSRSLFARGVHPDEQVERLTYPPELVDEIKPEMVSIEDITREDMSRIVNIDDWEHPAFLDPRIGDAVDFVLPWTLATDESYVNIAEKLMTENSFDLSMIYIQGTDTMGHRFWSFREDSDRLHNTLERYNLYPEDEEKFREWFGDAIDNYYVLADEFLGRLLNLIDDNTVVIICSDHGFGSYIGAQEPEWIGHSFTGSHRDAGSIVLWGPGIRQGKWLDEENAPHIWDVAPTILAIMGLPLADDMAGQPIMDAFDARFMQDYRPDFVATYDVNYKAGEKPESVPMSEQYEERLRSLGYIQ